MTILNFHQEQIRSKKTSFQMLPGLLLIILINGFFAVSTYGQSGSETVKPESSTLPAEADTPSQIISLPNHTLSDPQWSSCGRYLAFRAMGPEAGLWIEEEGSLRQLLAHEGVMPGFSWSSDEPLLLVQLSEWDARRRNQRLIWIDLDKQRQHEPVLPAGRLTGQPAWISGSRQIAFIAGGELQFLPTTHNAFDPISEKEPEKSRSFAWAKGGQLMLWEASSDQSRELADFGDRTVFNIRLSPDGEKIIFHVARQGMSVLSLSGELTALPERAERAVWMPDSRHVIAMQTRDDGHYITEGELIMIDVISGETRTIFSRQGVISLSPAISPDARKVAFENHQDGSIWIINNVF